MSEQLDEIRAKRAALAAARSSRDAAQQQSDIVQKEMLALKNDEAIEAAELAHGSLTAAVPLIAAVYTRLGVVIIRRASHLHFRRFSDTPKNNDGFPTVAAQEKLVFSSLVYPDKPTLEKWLEEQPATLIHLANAVALLAGGDKEATEGK